ncbi:MAG: S46 family peptidase, partial [Silanimonas sp.]
MRRLPLAAAVAATLIASAAIAREGMWVPQQLPEIAGPLKDAGLELSPEQLANLTGDPMGAVVALGGCTASFVSPNGLVATNHHCAYGAIQLNSTPEKNLMATGFNAATPADEVSAGPNARVFVMDEITDVTADMRAAIADAADGLARQNALEAKQKALIAACESEAGYRCTLYSFFGGQTFRLFRQMEIKDVRLAYAPPSSIGNYGGEVDNWMWPRHTGDFTFYRAYVGPDGKPAAFSKDNVPYQPKHWLKLADQPLEAGDFVMVAGYPGQTNRYALFDEFQNVAEWQYPVVGQHLKNVVALVEAAGKADADVEVKYAATIRGWQNAMKNWDGQLEGFQRIDALATKQAEEQAVLDWLRAGAAGAEGLDAKVALDAHAAL